MTHLLATRLNWYGTEKPELPKTGPKRCQTFGQYQKVGLSKANHDNDITTDLRKDKLYEQ